MVLEGPTGGGGARAGFMMRLRARAVASMLRGALLLAAVLPPSLEGAKTVPPAGGRRHPNFVKRQLRKGTLGVLQRGGIVPQLRGGGERAVFRKPVPAGLEESSLDEVVRKYYSDSPMAPTKNLLSLLRKEGRCSSHVIFSPRF